MRKIAIPLLVLGLAAVLVSPASATHFWTDSFSLTNQALGAAPVGTLNPATGWYTHSSGSNLGGSPTDLQIASSMCTGNHANQPDDSRPFVPGTTGASFTYSQPTTAKTYVCFLLRVPSSGVPTSTSYQYFAHFKDPIVTGTTFTCKLYAAGIAGAPTLFNIAINNTVTAGPYRAWTSPLLVDTWYTITMLYDGATGISKLWVNPATESSPSVSADGTAGSDPLLPGRALSAFALRQISASTSGTFQIDDVSVGTTFGETCGGFPTPTTRSTWGHIKTIYR